MLSGDLLPGLYWLYDCSVPCFRATAVAASDCREDLQSHTAEDTAAGGPARRLAPGADTPQCQPTLPRGQRRAAGASSMGLTRDTVALRSRSRYG